MSRRRLRRGNWSVQELERLRLLLPLRGVRTTATLLRRSPEGVFRKAMEIMRVPPRRGPWREADDDLLRDAWGVVDRRLLGALLGRTPSEVETRAAALRAAPRGGAWTAAERRRLRRFYGTRADEDLVVSLQRPAAEIAAMARQLCLAKDKRFQAAQRSRPGGGPAAPGATMPRWTREQIAALRALYAGTDNLAIARRLDRTVASVANKANQLGLRKSPALLARIGRVNVSRRYAPQDDDGGRESDATAR